MRRGLAKRYVISAAALVALGALRFTLEQFAEAQSVWRSIPFGWISAVLLAFVVGVFVQDWQSERSAVRARLRAAAKLFEVELVPASHANPQREWLELTAHITFTRAARSVRLVVKACSALGTHGEREFVLTAFDYPHVERGLREKIVVAVIPLARSDGKALGYQAWGNRFRESGDVADMQSLSDGTENVVHFEARAGWRAQRETVRFAVLSKELAGRRVYIPGV